MTSRTRREGVGAAARLDSERGGGRVFVSIPGHYIWTFASILCLVDRGQPVVIASYDT